MAPAPDAQTGSFIIEALVSVLIFAVGLIALMGMSAQAINQIGQTKYRNDASFLAGELIGQMWITSGAPSAFDTTAWLARVSDPVTGLPGGSAAVCTSASDTTCFDGTNCPTTLTATEVCIEISWSDKKDSSVRHRYTTSVHIAKN